jgi:hypothetical protein
MGKERLFEIFSKVNKIKLNEADSFNNDQENIVNEIRENIINTIKGGIEPKMFNDGIPSEILIKGGEQTIELKMPQENGLTLKNVNNGQFQYVAKYEGSVNNVNFEAYVDIYVDLNPVYTYEKYELKPQIMVSNEDVNIIFK